MSASVAKVRVPARRGGACDTPALLAELTEPAPQPRVTHVEEAELREVGDDLRQQDLAELALPRRVEHHLAALLDRQPRPLPDLLAQEAVTHADRRLVAELLPLA